MTTLTYLPIFLVALVVAASFAVDAYGKRYADRGHFGFVS